MKPTRGQGAGDHKEKKRGSARRLLITIDGPAGVGKSTVSQSLAKHLGYVYLDTGALYRAVAWKIQQLKSDPNDPIQVEAILSHTDIGILPQTDGIAIQIDGVVVEPGALRTPEVSQLASTIAALPRVRAWLLPVQRKFGEACGVVAEGRDMGTRVFPQADIKFFLDADVTVRAMRRHLEFAQKGRDQSLESVQEDMTARDRRDRTREIAPLYPAEEATIIDTSHQSADQVVEQMMKVIADRL
ncbi:MAG: (d)CMP kinase [Nitrospirales bacterium]|nr:(d)CMP kinase [Nitrospirales bacterium]